MDDSDDLCQYHVCLETDDEREFKVILSLWCIWIGSFSLFSLSLFFSCRSFWGICHALTLLKIFILNSTYLLFISGLNQSHVIFSHLKGILYEIEKLRHIVRVMCLSVCPYWYVLKLPSKIFYDFFFVLNYLILYSKKNCAITMVKPFVRLSVKLY